MKPQLKTGWIRGAIFSMLSFGVAHAVLIDKQITIQPIQLFNTAGTVSANTSLQLYEAATDLIWAQAGIDIKFLPWLTYNSDNYLSVSSNPGNGNSLLSLSQVAGQTWSGPTSNNIVKMFFVQQIDGSNGNLGFTVQSQLKDAGFGYVVTQQTAIAIADNTFNLGYIDVIAHEIGHALGLNHTTLGAGGALNIMTAGGAKTPVTFINNIYPNGADVDFLTGTIGGTDWGNDLNGALVGYQIDRARKMDISVTLPGGQQYIFNQVIPEPATTAAIAGALMLAAVMVVRRYRSRADQCTGAAARA